MNKLVVGSPAGVYSRPINEERISKVGVGGSPPAI
jgi:hypothetical protein